MGWHVANCNIVKGTILDISCVKLRFFLHDNTFLSVMTLQVLYTAHNVISSVICTSYFYISRNLFCCSKST